ncbi:hypothetical protein [Streptomyces aureus]|uniref:hypothetical protein n=1 Tax=Streptomyces aureus TaxID=193461 RepID=UPI0036C66557
MLADLSPLIAAATEWLTRAYPACGGPLASALCEAQARQAVTVAAWLRYPTAMDAAPVAMAGPGGAGRLDWIVGADTPDIADTTRSVDGSEDDAWRTWVDEAVVSWAASLLTDDRLAGLAVAALADGEHTTAAPVEFGRLRSPDEGDRRAAALLRHPDLLDPVASLHREELLGRLGTGQTLVA